MAGGDTHRFLLAPRLQRRDRPRTASRGRLGKCLLAEPCAVDHVIPVEAFSRLGAAGVERRRRTRQIRATIDALHLIRPPAAKTRCQLWQNGPACPIPADEYLGMSAICLYPAPACSYTGQRQWVSVRQGDPRRVMGLAGWTADRDGAVLRVLRCARLHH